MNYALRNAHDTDFEFLKNLHHQTLRPYVEPLWGWDEAEQDRLFEERFEPRSLQVILVNNEPAGLLQIEEFPHELFLTNMLVKPSLQRQGLGSKILRDLTLRATVIGKTIGLTVLQPNPARRLYERHGFKVTGQNEHRYFMKWYPPAPAVSPP